jgi:hypothetical protein
MLHVRLDWLLIVYLTIMVLMHKVQVSVFLSLSLSQVQIYIYKGLDIVARFVFLRLFIQSPFSSVLQLYVVSFSHVREVSQVSIMISFLLCLSSSFARVSMFDCEAHLLLLQNYYKLIKMSL